MTTAMGWTSSRPGREPTTTNGDRSRASAAVDRDDRRDALLRRRGLELPGGLRPRSSRSSVCARATKRIAVLVARPSTASNPSREPRDSTPSVTSAGRNTAREAQRHRREDQSRQSPAAERGLEQQERSNCCRDGEPDHPARADLLGRAVSAGPRRGTRAGGRSRRGAARGRPRRRRCCDRSTPATMSMRRDTASRWMTAGVSAMRTSATWPSRTWPPPGRSMSRLRTSSTLSRVFGAPCTMTSKTFCSSNTLPTWMPCSSVASARRTSPGVTPKLCALSRSTSISIVGCRMAAGRPAGRRRRRRRRSRP